MNTKLSKKEAQVNRLVNKGMKVREIAEKLGVTTSSIAGVKQRTKRKLGGYLGTPLTPLEQEIVTLKQQKKTNSDISVTLGKSVFSVEQTIIRITHKLGNNNFEINAHTNTPIEQPVSNSDIVNDIEDDDDWGSVDGNPLYSGTPDTTFTPSPGMIENGVSELQTTKPISKLTKRQSQIYALREDGKTPLEMSKILGITPMTVYAHTYAMKEKLGESVKKTNNPVVQSKLPNTTKSPIEKILFSELPDREREIATLLSDGKKPKEIGAILNISHKTVATNKYRIFEKLGITNLIELSHLAIKDGAISVDNVVVMDNINLATENTDENVNYDDIQALRIAKGNRYTSIDVDGKTHYTCNLDTISQQSNCSTHIIMQHLKTTTLPIKINNCTIYDARDFNDCVKAGKSLPTATVLTSVIHGDYIIKNAVSGEVFTRLTEQDLVNKSIDIPILKRMVNLYGYPITFYGNTVYDTKTYNLLHDDMGDSTSIEQNIVENDFPTIENVKVKKEGFFKRFFG